MQKLFEWKSSKHLGFRKYVKVMALFLKIPLKTLLLAGYKWVSAGTDGYRWVSVGTGYQWVPVGISGYQRVPMGTGGYRWVLVGTGRYWLVPVGTSVHWLSLSITLLQT